MSLLPQNISRFRMAVLNIRKKEGKVDFRDFEVSRFPSVFRYQEIVSLGNHCSGFQFRDYVRAVQGNCPDLSDREKCDGFRGCGLSIKRVEKYKPSAQVQTKAFFWMLCSKVLRSMIQMRTTAAEKKAGDGQKSANFRKWHPFLMTTDIPEINHPIGCPLPDRFFPDLHGERSIPINQADMPSSNSTKAPATVAFLGPEGTFSHLVVLKRFPKRTGLPVATITEVFHAVASGKAGLGVVPIENSSGGTITETVDLLIELAGRIFITEELALDVRLALLGKAGTAFSKLKSVYSHVMPLRHHRDWIMENLPGVAMIESPSTAEAAKKASFSATSAALAAPGAALLYGLSILKFPVRPEALNITHFFVISARPSAAFPAPSAERCKTAIVATLPQTSGSLHRFLGPFARAGVNLCRIVSRPVPGQPETYVFYLEVEGSIGEAKVKKALVGARRLSESLELPGSYTIRARYRSSH